MTDTQDARGLELEVEDGSVLFARPAQLTTEWIRHLVETSQVEEARRLLAAAEYLTPELHRWARVLRPPQARFRERTRPLDLDASMTWLHEHATEYPGEWLAVRNGVLVAHGKVRREVIAQLEPTRDEGEALLVMAGG